MLPDSEFIARDTASHPPALTPIYKTSVLRSPAPAAHLPPELPVRGDRARSSARTSSARSTTT